MSITSIRLHEGMDKPPELLAKKLGGNKIYIINQAIKESLAKQSLEDSQWIRSKRLNQ